MNEDHKLRGQGDRAHGHRGGHPLLWPAYLSPQPGWTRHDVVPLFASPMVLTGQRERYSDLPPWTLDRTTIQHTDALRRWAHSAFNRNEVTL